MSDHQTAHAAESFCENLNPTHKAATEGRHLPSLQELLSLCPFMHNDLRRDATAWVEAARPRVMALDPNAAAVLDRMLDRPTAAGFEDAASQLRKMAGRLTGNELSAAADRVAFYAGALGCPDAALQTARAAAELSKTSSMTLEERREMAAAAIGWLWESTPPKPSVGLFRQLRLSPRLRVNHFSASTMALLGVDPKPVTAESEGELPVWTPEQKGRAERVAAGRSAPKPQQDAVVDVISTPTPTLTQGGVVVMASIGSSATSSGQRITEEMNGALEQSFPLVLVPDLMAVKAELLREFPHLAGVIDAALRDMQGRTEVMLRPLLLVGMPGGGKTRFARRLLETLGVSPVAYPCGGVADAAIAGTARKWESATPSLPLARILDTRIANPGIILDELEKTGTSRHNGNPADALLGLLEPLTSAVWLDPYLQAPVDVSHVCWIATTNSLQCLSKPLLDRFQVVRLPEPGPEHLEALANSLIRATVDDCGFDPGLGQPLDGTELQSLGSFWKGGSVRSLAKLVNGVLRVRNMPSGPAH